MKSIILNGTLEGIKCTYSLNEYLEAPEFELHTPEGVLTDEDLICMGLLTLCANVDAQIKRDMMLEANR